MAGLLDFFSPDDPAKRQSLLASAAKMLELSGPSPVPRSFGQIAGASVGAYNDSMNTYQDRQKQQALYDLKLRGLQGELDDKDQSRADTLAAQDWMRKYNQGGQSSPTDVARATLGSDMSPTVDNAAKLAAATPQQAAAPDAFTQRMAQAQAMRGSGNPLLMAQADKLEEAVLKFKPKFSTDFRPALGSDGKLHNYLLSDDGTAPRDSGLGVAPNLTEVDLGATKQFVDKNGIAPGTIYRKTQSPDSIAVDRRAAADRAATGSAGGASIDLSDATVDAIGQGRMQPPTGYALRNPKIANLMDRVAAKYPEFDATEYSGKTKAMRDFTTGKQGDSIRSFAVATDHLTQLKGLITALDNGNTPLINKYSNIVAQQTGSVAPTNFDAAKGIVAKEVLKSIVAGGGGVDERQELAHLLDNAKTNKQLIGVVDTYTHLMGAQRDGLLRQYEISTGRKDGPTRFSYGAPDGGHGAAGAPQAAAQKFDMLPPATQFDGKRMKADNGTIYRSVGGKWVKE